MKALILAGGFAKRLWPLTTDKAKPLLPLGGRPLLSHLVDKIPAGIPIIVSTNRAFAADFAAWRERHPDRDITIFIEDAQTEGTKKGALAAVGLAVRSLGIDEDLLIVGGDNFFTFDLADFLAKAGSAPLLAAYDIGDREQAKKFGVVVADGDRIQGFEEKPAEPRSTLVSTCCYFLPKASLPRLHEAASLTPDKIGALFEYLLAQGEDARVYRFTGYWNDIGSFQGYLDAHRESGLSLSVPEKFLHPALGNRFEGINHIDEDCTIEQAIVSDSIILKGCTLQNCEVHSCIVDAGCEILGGRVEGQIISRKD